MKPLRAALQFPLALPAYWKACRTARQKMQCSVRKEYYGNHPKQYFLVAEPAETTAVPGRHAFYFHGGGWTFGQPETFLPSATPWLNQGFRVVLPSFRRPPTVGLNRIMDDCRAAITIALHEEPVTLLQLGGISSGAHLAAMLGMETDFWARKQVPQPSAILACAGPMSFKDLTPGRLFLPRYQHLDPLQNIPTARPASPEWLLLHGTKDATVDLKHSRQFQEALQEKGYQARLDVLQDGTHLDAGRWMFGGSLARDVETFIAENLLP